jgi:hypothetical protein
MTEEREMKLSATESNMKGRQTVAKISGAVKPCFQIYSDTALAAS